MTENANRQREVQQSAQHVIALGGPLIRLSQPYWKAEERQFTRPQATIAANGTDTQKARASRRMVGANFDAGVVSYRRD